MKRTIVDITQLVHWPGELTGIPRVANELALRFAKLKTEVIFVTWVKEIADFCELDFAKTMAVRGKGIEYATTSSVKNIPAVMEHKQLLKRIAKKGLSGVKRLNPRFAEAIENRAKMAQINTYRRVDFKQGDRLFIPWGEWWDETFIVRLEQLHGQGIKLVQVLHDMSPIVVPQFSNSGNAVKTYPIYCRRIFPKVALLLAVSQNSKHDAQNWLKKEMLKTPKIEVFRLGEDFKIAKPTAPKDPAFKKSGLKGGDFIMCVGTIELKKNHHLLYYVYKLAKARGISLPKLVIVGRKGWMSDATIELITKDPEVKDKIVVMLNTGDEELSWLYDHCMFTVLPSFYEGWGMPVAESVARGVPCICSNTSSMTEIAEGFVWHFTPSSSDECLDAIKRLADPTTLKTQRAKVKKYRSFSWDQSFQQVLKSMKEIE